MFTCAASVGFPAEARLDVQTLLSVSFAMQPGVADDHLMLHWSRYQKACAELLALFSRTAHHGSELDSVLDPAENQEYQTLVKDVGSSLLIMLDALILGDFSQVRCLYNHFEDAFA